MPARIDLRSRITLLVAAALALAAGIALSIRPAVGASSSAVVVQATVMSATNLDVTGCATGVAGRTDFGAVMPGTALTTTSDCTVVFGSSNSTATLSVGQADAAGVGMHQMSAGALDLAYDGDGKKTTTVAATNGSDYTGDAKLQADRKPVLFGNCAMGGSTGMDFCIVRYTTAGALDTTFDGDGRATTAIGPTGGADLGMALVVQPDGKLVGGGQCAMGATNIDFCLARYNADGSLDTTFGTAGKVTTAVVAGAGNDNLQSLALQPDGKLVAGGDCATASNGVDFCLARYTADGALDTTFGTGGIVTTPFGAGTATDALREVALQANGSIVAAGGCAMGGSTGIDACVARYTAAGALDTSWDGDGKVTTAVGPGSGADELTSAIVLADGRIVVSGYCDAGATWIDMCLIRYGTTGALDTGFSGDGITTLDLSSGGKDVSWSVDVQPDGKLLAGGVCYFPGFTGGDHCLARFTAAGAPDNSFGGSGTVVTPIAPGTNDDIAVATLTGTDGRIIAAGYCNMGAGATGIDICLSQYDSAGVVQQYANASADWDTVGTSMFGACLRATSATPAWTQNASCPMTDGAYWNAVPATPAAIASASSGVTTASAALRFGMRTTTSQVPGDYVAPITFTVTAP